MAKQHSKRGELVRNLTLNDCGTTGQTMSNEMAQPDYRQSLHDSIVATAEGLIARSVGVVEAARRFMELAAELDAWEDDDLLYFQDIDSQSDAFPLGIARQQWDPAALVREDHAR